MISMDWLRLPGRQSDVVQRRIAAAGAIALLSCFFTMANGGRSIARDSTSPAQKYTIAQPHMGTLVRISLYARDEQQAQNAADRAFETIARLNKVLSNYLSESELSRLGRSAPTEKPAPVSDELWQVLAAAQSWSEKTDGAFDVTIGPLSKLWRRARSKREMPSEERLAAAMAAVGHQKMRLHEDRQSVSLTAPNMLLDLGGIAKGYIADQALAAMRAEGVESALVNAGGDLAIGKAPPDKKGWKIGVAPLTPKSEPSEFLLLSDCGVATSGDAWQFVKLDGRRYSHIIDPQTGIGLTHRLGVTVIASDAMAADALASAVSVLGVKKGLELVDKVDGASAMIVQPKTEETAKRHVSTRWPG